MFQLLQPIWLSALAGVSIPVIIHLWNQRPGKTLKVGSIALVKAHALSPVKKIRLSDRSLLLLRCLLLACIALALTRPVWRMPPDHSAKGWVLMPRAELPATYKRFKPRVDSLLRAGAEFHYLEEGFTKATIEQAVQSPEDSLHPGFLSYRNAIALLNQQADPTLPLYIFTDNYLRNFSGSRSETSLPIHWYTYAPDSSRLINRSDTAAVHVTIFTQVYNNDAHYLHAALDAISQFSKKNIVVQSVAATAAIPTKQDWLFWLDDKLAVDTKAAKNVLLYAKGEVVKRGSFLSAAGGPSFAPVELYKAIENDTPAAFAAPRWQDGFGHCLLSVQQKDATSRYTLYTHFDPAWNGLPWSDNFPVIMYGLMFSDKAGEQLGGAMDRTMIDVSQATPVFKPVKDTGMRPILFIETKLAGICWLAVFLLFFAERIFSFHYYKANANE